MISSPILLIGGQDVAAIGKELETMGVGQVKNYCGQLSLAQSACLIREAELVISHDTGMMHIAAAFKKQIFSIWGNTIPSFGMYPYRTKFTIFENNNIDCRPCSKIGYDKCPKGHFKCMNEVVFDFYLP